MKSVEFYDLPRPVQERFVAAAQASLAPAPLAIRLASRFVGAAWFLGAGISFAATAVWVGRGFGELHHPSALTTARDAILYCIGFALSFACLSRGLAARDRALSLPFARGTYLFPAGVVEAMSSSLSVYALSELSQVEATTNSLNVTFGDGTSFRFPASDPHQAQAARTALDESQSRLREATENDDTRQLAALDPLCETSFPSPFSRDVPFQPPTSWWAVSLFAMALASGTALGVGVWKVRNSLSEKAIALRAREVGTTDAYRAYLARGGSNRQISNVLLPRAELNEIKAGGVPAIEAYVARHPHSAIQGEIDATLRKALLSALDEAKKPGSLAALAGFKKEYPRHAPVASELAAARHAIFEKAAQQASSRGVALGSRTSDPAVFFQHLVRHAERHGPEVEIRFGSREHASHKRADAYVRRSRYFGGTSTLPSRQFRAELMAQREALAGELLMTALQSAFSAEIVRFQLGERLPPRPEDDAGSDFPAVTVPTLFVEHRAKLSGRYVNRNPRRIVAGASIFFRTAFVIPGNDYVLKATVSTWRTPTRSLMRSKERSTQEVYEDLVRRAFTRFLTRYVARVLEDPPDVAMPPLPDAAGSDD